MVTQRKRPASKPSPKLTRPDFDKGMKITEKLIKENVLWLKEMAKR